MAKRRKNRTRSYKRYNKSSHRLRSVNKPLNRYSRASRPSVRDAVRPVIRSAYKVIQADKKPRSVVKKKLYTTVVSKDVQKLRKDIICQRRKIRKEVMHAIKKAGQAGQKKPRYLNRNIKC